MKKLLFLGTAFHIGLLCAQFETFHQDRQKSRVFEVMYKGPGGIEASNKKIMFAEVKNLGLDLNLAEISARFGCLTQMGQNFLFHYLEKMVSPKDQNSTIKTRQKLIKLLIDNPDLLNKFDTILQDAIAHEAKVMKFMAKRFVFDEKVYEQPIEFVQHSMNSKTIFQAWHQFSSSQTVVFSPWIMQDKYKIFVKAVNNFNDAQKKILSGLTFTNLSDAQKALLSGLTFASVGSYAYTSSMPGFAAQDMLSTAFATILASYGLYKHYTEAIEIRNSLYALNQLIHIATEIENVSIEHRLDHQFKLSSIQSPEGRQLLVDLGQDRYTNKDNYLILTPAVHTFVYEIYEHDRYLAPIYASIGEIDAYVAIAKTMIKLQSGDHTFCFAQFLDDQQPTIYAKNFWNMLVNQENVVVNDIFERRNIILTGSNEGGKTTAIRAILQNIVLAQTFGVAAASEFKLTPFDVIHSYLNVSDDILNGKSRFASELKQAQDILQRIKQLQPSEKFFFAFDELFTGTNGEDGAECAYRFIDNVASYSGIQFLYATHFNKLKMIGSVNPACVNYKIEPPLRNDEGHFIRDGKGQLIYPYKMSLGANDINVAMDRAKDAGIFA